MDTQDNNQSWPPKPNPNPMMGTGEGESPITNPGTPKIDVRTFASDISSMQSSGGSAPRPYVPPPPPVPPRAPMSAPASPIVPKMEPPMQSFRPPQTPQTTAPTKMAATIPEPKKKGGGLFKAIFVLIILVALGAVGYFVIYPKFFSPTVTPAPIGEVTPPPAPVTPPPAPQTPPPAPQVTHTSLFKSPADSTMPAMLASFDIGSFRASIPNAVSPSPSFKEVLLQDKSGNGLDLASLSSVLGLRTISNLTTLEPDFTFFVYSNTKGTWPGIVLKLKAGSPLTNDIQNQASAVESTGELANLFLTDPGNPGAWKGGTTSGVQNRYVSFPSSNSVINYGWWGNELVISTSYDGFKEALRRLQ